MKVIAVAFAMVALLIAAGASEPAESEPSLLGRFLKELAERGSLPSFVPTI